MEQQKCSVLSERYVLDVMRHLLSSNQKECTVSDLSDIVKSPRTRELLIGRLRDEGLLSVRTIDKPRRTIFISLTDHGRDVAAALDQAYKVYTGAPDTEEPETNCRTPEKVRDPLKEE